MKIRLEITEKGNIQNIRFDGDSARSDFVTYMETVESSEILVTVSKEGGRASAEFEGEQCKMNAIRFVNSYVDSDSKQSVPSVGTMNPDPASTQDALTLKERLQMFLKYEYPKVWFSSIDVKNQYERIYGNIGISTVSTYLARMCREGVLERRGNRVQREYRIKDELIPHVVMPLREIA